MTDSPGASARPNPIPPDDPRRSLVLARPDEDRDLPHVAMVGDTYTILLKGEDTAGLYCLIDMHIPPGGGPPPHRHDFEEMFAVLEGEIEVHLPRREVDGASRGDRQHPGQRAARVYQRLRPTSPAAVHVLARRAEKVLPGRGRPRR